MKETNGEKLSILFMTAEAWPYAKVGGLGDVMGSLPPALAALGHDVTVAMPFYRSVWKKYKTQQTDLRAWVLVGDRPHNVMMRKVKRSGVTFYFLDSPFAFDRENIYNHPDDGERFITFCLGTLRLIKAMGQRPDVIHCNDWQTALVPALLKTTLAGDPFFKDVASVFSIHNLAYQGVFPYEYLHYAGLPGEEFHYSRSEFYGQLNFMKTGITHADVITTVSPSYAEEIQTPEYGEKLDGHLRAHSGRLAGILNGIDTKKFNPATDKNIFAKYSATDPSIKYANKAKLMRLLGLEEGENAPFVGIISRLTWQKGLDLVAASIERILELGAKLVVLGTGDAEIEYRLTYMAKKHPKEISVNLKFDEKLANRIYAASDIFLMPSRFEPCGLGQMIAMRYGSIPVARATGGLADTIVDIAGDPDNGTGWLFHDYSADALMEALGAAVKACADETRWREIVLRAMRRDFTWDTSSREYLAAYRKAMERSD